MTTQTTILTPVDDYLSTTNSPNNLTTNPPTNSDAITQLIAEPQPIFLPKSSHITAENHLNIDTTQAVIIQVDNSEIADTFSSSIALLNDKTGIDLANIMVNQANIIDDSHTSNIVTPISQTPSSSSSKKKVNRVRDKALKIRFSESEYQQLSQKAGNQSLAAFMRDYCLAAPDYRPKRPAALPKIDPALLRLLAGATNNLNQIARHLNQQAARNQTVQIAWAAFELSKVADSLWRIEHASKIL